MPGILKNARTAALDRICGLAEDTATIYASLAELAANDRLAHLLQQCADRRTETANELMVARRESGELPAAGHPERAGLQALGLKLSSAVGDTDSMLCNLREMDTELEELARAAAAHETEEQVKIALRALIQSIAEAAASLSDA